MRGSEVADEDLMLRYRDGDAAAFEALYARHRAPLYRFVRRQCESAATADDLFQDVWARLIDARERYRPDARFTTWLYRIARNRVIDHHRARAVRAAVSAPAAPRDGDDDPPDVAQGAPGDPGLEPDSRLAAERAAERLLAALAALPAEQREAFLLHEEAGMDVAGIAAATGVGRETAKSRLRYAVNRLKRAIEGHAVAGRAAAGAP